MKQKEKLVTLFNEIDELIQYAFDWEIRYTEKIEQVHPKYTESARNLVHYCALKSKNLNSLQKKLGNLGLSRLSESEAHIMASLQTTRSILISMQDEKSKFLKHQLSFKKSRRLIRRNAKALLGYRSKGRRTRVMVTLPSKAAKDYQFVCNLIKNGMNCARINCAHDSTEDWQNMIEYIKKASKKHRKRCKISMDLGGPKIRTGAIAKDAKIIKIQHSTDALGNEIKSITVFFGENTTDKTEIPTIPITNFDPDIIKEGDLLHITDNHFKRRKIKVLQVMETGFLGEIKKVTYFETGLPIKIDENNCFIIGELDIKKRSIFLKEKDILIIKKGEIAGHGKKILTETGEIEPACISCTSNEIFSMVKEGETILFDDGIIEGIIKEVTPEEIRVLITVVPSNGGKLKPDKGINFPQSELKFSSLSDKDKHDLQFILENANVINMSFVNHQDDVSELLELIDSDDIDRKMGLILKIETSSGFDNLSEIILESMKNYPIGVMIARGDLAVELGWERIGRIQEEILSICEAAHITSIWATQVLENLAKKGIPSRAEITDTVMAQRADCIMLNKGSYILRAIKLLDSILKNLKKSSTALKPIQD